MFPTIFCWFWFWFHSILLYSCTIIFLNQSLVVEYLGAATNNSVINSRFQYSVFLWAGNSEDRFPDGGLMNQREK